MASTSPASPACSPLPKAPGVDRATPTRPGICFGAWLLAATMNAMLTWWGVSLAVLGHETLGNAVVSRATLIRVVPIFVALLVWLIRVLIIGTFSVAGDRLFTQDDARLPRPARNQLRPGPMQTAFTPVNNRPHSNPQSNRSFASPSHAQQRPGMKNSASAAHPSRPIPTARSRPITRSAPARQPNPCHPAAQTPPDPALPSGIKLAAFHDLRITSS